MTSYITRGRSAGFLHNNKRKRVSVDENAPGTLQMEVVGYSQDDLEQRTRGISLDSLCESWPEAVRKKDLGRGVQSTEIDWFKTSSERLWERVRICETEKDVLAREMNGVDSVLENWWHQHCARRNETTFRVR